MTGEKPGFNPEREPTVGQAETDYRLLSERLLGQDFRGDARYLELQAEDLQVKADDYMRFMHRDHVNYEAGEGSKAMLENGDTILGIELKKGEQPLPGYWLFRPGSIDWDKASYLRNVADQLQQRSPEQVVVVEVSNGESSLIDPAEDEGFRQVMSIIESTPETIS